MLCCAFRLRPGVELPFLTRGHFNGALAGSLQFCGSPLFSLPSCCGTSPTTLTSTRAPRRAYLAPSQLNLYRGLLHCPTPRCLIWRECSRSTCSVIWTAARSALGSVWWYCFRTNWDIIPSNVITCRPVRQHFSSRSDGCCCTSY